MRRSLVLVSLLASATAYALPPGSVPTLETGANHHIGDASFIEAFGRKPTRQDDERVRMTTHLTAVRNWLASRPATKPELAPQRAALIAALDRYIAKGTTPRNTLLPWRTPVFIDEEGTICAVGYLIESSAGREVAEKIARAHRYDFIENIAADMPEVADWIAQSGMTLEEIQTIQPAYSEPEVMRWRTWDLVKFPPKDGPSHRYGDGTWKDRNMDGPWQVTDGETVRGRGTMKRGRGAWTSFYVTGEKLAEGRYVTNQPDGRWKMFHRSGNVAAEGMFDSGIREGKWRFYYDTPQKQLIAVGRFGGDGSVVGRWQHFDSEGKLLARSWTETPTQWQDNSYAVNGGEGSVLAVLPGKDGVAHAIHQGTPGKDVEANDFRLELFAKGRERIYIQKGSGDTEEMFTAEGWRLAHTDAGWAATDCHWSATRKRIAAAGDVARLNGVLSNDVLHRTAVLKKDEWDSVEDPGPTCTGAMEISTKRAAKLDVLLASRDALRSASPDFVRKLVLGQEADAMPADDDENKDETLRANDLARVLAGNMAMYIEWPHIDRRFQLVYDTMPGHYSQDWASRNSETDDDVNHVESN